MSAIDVFNAAIELEQFNSTSVTSSTAIPTNTNNPAHESANHDQSSSHRGVIIGSAVGGFGFTVMAVLIVILLRRRRHLTDTQTLMACIDESPGAILENYSHSVEPFTQSQHPAGMFPMDSEGSIYSHTL